MHMDFNRQDIVNCLNLIDDFKEYLFDDNQIPDELYINQMKMLHQLYIKFHTILYSIDQKRK